MSSSSGSCTIAVAAHKRLSESIEKGFRVGFSAFVCRYWTREEVKVVLSLIFTPNGLSYIFESKETKQSGSKKGKNTKEENGSQEKMVARFQFFEPLPPPRKPKAAACFKNASCGPVSSVPIKNLKSSPSAITDPNQCTRLLLVKFRGKTVILPHCRWYDFAAEILAWCFSTLIDASFEILPLKSSSMIPFLQGSKWFPCNELILGSLAKNVTAVDKGGRRTEGEEMKEISEGLSGRSNWLTRFLNFGTEDAKAVLTTLTVTK
ncbi:hypothetical protein Vadar_018904 [Vaccinium darrowii]|uniref:Uncharacterized protein n=1 Tax=Vaccinium darrowii TaxID=229202 RepID=A0ACB7XAR6_9ERIC|nr:hypothetical protein Vadar_018904 [Vaccinium darrowii]